MTDHTWPPESDEPPERPGPPLQPEQPWEPTLEIGPPTYDVLDLSPTPEPSKPGRTLGTTVLAIIGAITLVGGGLFAASQLASSNGAATPEGAVQQLIDAVNDEDALGALSSLHGPEREFLVDAAQRLSDELVRLKVVPADFELGSVDGVDIEITDPQFEVTDVTDDVKVVQVTSATAKLTTTPSEAPIGPVVKDLAGQDPTTEPPTTDIEHITRDDDFKMAVVNDDGWHVSLTYTAAEAARQDAGQPVPDFDELQPKGADSPEAAVRQVVDAIAALDLRTGIESLPPDLWAALYDYAPLFLDDAEQAIDEFRQQEDLNIDVTKLDLDTETDGDHATVRLKGFAVEANSDSESVELSYDGRCGKVVNNGKTDTFCAGSLDDESLKNALGPDWDVEVPQELVDVGKKFEGFNPGIAVVRRDGKWYVSPETTLTDLVFGVLERLESGDIKKLTTGFSELSDEFFGAMLGESFEEVGSAIGSDTFSEGSSGPVSPELVLPPGQVPTREQLVALLKATPMSFGSDTSCLAGKVLAKYQGAELRQFYDAILGINPSRNTYSEFFDFVRQCPG